VGVAGSRGVIVVIIAARAVVLPSTVVVRVIAVNMATVHAAAASTSLRGDRVVAVIVEAHRALIIVVAGVRAVIVAVVRGVIVDVLAV